MLVLSKERLTEKGEVEISMIATCWPAVMDCSDRRGGVWEGGVEESTAVTCGRGVVHKLLNTFWPESKLHSLFRTCTFAAALAVAIPSGGVSITSFWANMDS